MAAEDGAESCQKEIVTVGYTADFFVGGRRGVWCGRISECGADPSCPWISTFLFWFSAYPAALLRKTEQATSAVVTITMQIL